MSELPTPARPKPPLAAIALSSIGGLFLAAGILAMFAPEVVAGIHPDLVEGRLPLGLIMIGLGFEAMGLKGVLSAAARNQTVPRPDKPQP